MKIKHIETIIQTTFGAEDEDGNIYQLFRCQADPQKEDPLFFRKFTKENFEKAFEALINIRNELLKKE